MHRALAHFQLGPRNLAIAISLFLFFSAIWIACLPWTCDLWTQIFALALRVLPLHADLVLTERFITPSIRFEIPSLAMASLPPSLVQWSLTCAATLLLLAVTFFFPSQWIPLTYLLRGVVLVQATALIYFAVFPVSFPHTPGSYLAGFAEAGLALISLVPLLLGLTFYIFDFGLMKKAFITFVIMVYLMVFIPFQMLLQALILQHTVLFMPLLYIVFGIPVDVMVIIAFYSWGMSWPFRTAAPRSIKSRKFTFL
jgi:hypothetical protein